MSLRIKPFYLLRHQDPSGISGTGIIAVGVIYPNGQAHMQWVTYRTSFEMHDSIENLMEIHGHSGLTELVYGETPCTEEIKKPRKGRSARKLAP